MLQGVGFSLHQVPCDEKIECKNYEFVKVYV